MESTLQDNKAFLEKLDGSDSETSLSDVSSSEFEDVIAPPKAKKQKLEHYEESDGEIEWEDAIQEDPSITPKVAPEPSGDLVLNLGGNSQKDTRIKSNRKQGPSKIERQIRMTTHQMHVQFLLFHNLLRSGWACDEEVQATLLGQLTLRVKKEINKWKTASGQEVQPVEEKSAPLRHNIKGRRKSGKALDDVRSQREWGKPAERQEKGAPNMSSAEPVIRLLKVLAAYWKKRFTITTPGLRKQGYKPLAQLEAEINSFKNHKHNVEDHGERIESVNDFRKCAKACEGSRDVGVQLFAALIRGLGSETRLIASLQPAGFGWTKNEEASMRKKQKVSSALDIAESSIDSAAGSDAELIKPTKTPKSTSKRKGPSEVKREDLMEISDEDDSVIDVTPATPRRKPNMHYDRDLVFPTYWIEAISPITHEVYPVEPFILNSAVATNAEHLSAFESRGTKADKSKQVFAYIIAYSSDGTAKDVTTRYLKRHMWPGRTKGVRIPVEKVPIYNKRGKIKRYENYDWFKTVISGYKRPHNKRTAADDLEDAKDLKPVKPEKKEKKDGEETLQGYKNSAEYVLERHLRREEAILPGAEPVKTFITGKGDNAKEEPVFLRKDVMVCRTGESWHKEGRQIKVGETPMKMVPVRAVTLTRKREVEEAQKEGGEKLKQGLYSWDQTDWIIPPPIENGIIPKNAFGNMDCYVPTMVPKGAVHIPLRSTMKICKRLGIDYAEAVTGFEFGKQRAVPVITGVVVAAEHENKVIDEWEKDEEERKRKEDEKREKAALALWRKMVMGLRIHERVRNEYADDEVDLNVKEASNPFTRQSMDTRKDLSQTVDEDTAGGFIVDAEDWEGGGFLPEGYPVGNERAPTGGGGFIPDAHHDAHGGGGFLPNADDDEHGGGDLIIENEATAKLCKPRLPSPAAEPAQSHNRQFDDAGTESSRQPSPPPPKKRGRPSKSSASATPRPKARQKSKNTPKSETKLITNGAHPSPGSDTKTPPQRTSTRTSGRKSASAVKSRYFEGSDEEDGDEDDGSSSEGKEFKPEPRVKAKGGGRRRGRRKTAG